jgi:carbamoyl-phosphate synthase small subunit
MMIKKSAVLVLSDGTIFEGISVGAEGYCVGELVFNTAMTGYQEIMTDPSYAKQIVLFTAAHLGNVGCNLEDAESSRIWASGMVMRECSPVPSNYRSQLSLPDWLIKNGKVAIAGIDTRKLSLHLQKYGAMNACISTNPHDKTQSLEMAKNFAGLNGADLAKIVSRQTIERWHGGLGSWALHSKPLVYHVVAYDFGVKQSILRILYDLGCHITLVPAQTSAAEVLSLNPDGILLSNGPGDPKACNYAIEAIKTLLETEVPILGICLGFQLLGLACGAHTTKMKFGHHGANHPVKEIGDDGRVLITSQNHGFSLEEESLPKFLEVTHRSLFDNSLQGIKHRLKPAFGFQGHPESSPGPHDIEGIFDQFIKMMAERANHPQEIL